TRKRLIPVASSDRARRKQQQRGTGSRRSPRSHDFGVLRLLEVLTDLRSAEAPVSPQRPDGGDLARARPTGDRLGVHAEQGGDFRWRKECVWSLVLVHGCPSCPIGTAKIRRDRIVSR